MSGGSYDYAYSKIDELERWVSTLTQMADTCRRAAVEVEQVYETGKSPRPATLEDRALAVVRAMLLEKAAAHLKGAVDEVKALQPIMRDVEWVESRDYGLDDLCRPIKATAR